MFIQNTSWKFSKNLRIHTSIFLLLPSFLWVKCPASLEEKRWNGLYWKNYLIINIYLYTSICFKQKVLNSTKTNIWFDLKLFNYLVPKVLVKNFIYENSFNNIKFPINEFVIWNKYLLFIELIQEFNKFGLIQPKVKLMSHNYYLDIQDLNTFNISDGFVLYEKIGSK